MRRSIFIFLPVLLAFLWLPLISAFSASPSPAETAADIREALFAAQMALTSSPAQAEKALAAAQAAYAGSFAQQIQRAAPQADERIRSGFADAARFVAQESAAGYAAARAQVWTGILDGSNAIVEQAIQAEEPSTAQSWLPVREFRTTTRFSRPSTGATLALATLAQEKSSPADTLLAVRADLFDTYQAELTETLHQLQEADSQGFSVRRAELAGLAEGYFQILAPAYGRERGPAAQQTAQAAFRALRAAALAGQDLADPIQQIDTALARFRAAPLTPEEQSRRAGQLLRYLSLVPLEYNRGVKDSQVIHNFEIQEAITFQSGAYAAFTDLQTQLETIDPGATDQVKTRLDALGQQLSQAARGGPVTPGDTIEDQAQAISAQIKGMMPAEWVQGSSTGDFDVIASMLDQMEAAVLSNNYPAAEAARLEAYAILEVGPEARLMSFAPQLKLELEDLFWNGQAEEKGLAYLIKNQAPHSEIRTTRTKLDAILSQAQTILKAGSAPTAVAANAGMIVFREGLEAVIILASLMSSMKRREEHKYRRPMWLGALLALAATFLTWVLAHDVLQSLARYGEKLEAVVSLIAIVILLVIMNWFFHKLYWTEWIAGFHTRKRQIISGEAGLWLGLITLGFTSVYREGFESVLFLQALVLESGLRVVLSGVAAAFAAVCLVGFATFRLQVNLPYKKMLVVTGVLIGAVLLQMVGSTVHVFQVVGWMPIHAIGGHPLPYWTGTWFGLYATWEGLACQALAGLFVIGSYYLAEGLKHNHGSGKTGLFSNLLRKISGSRKQLEDMNQT
jgi:high-affinity iron transporter